jgi:hypothetical protein
MSWPQREALASLCTSILFLPHLFAPTGLTFAFGGQRLYAANRGTTPSINRKNRVLRAPATTDSCDIGADDPERVAFRVSFRGDRGVVPPGLNLPVTFEALRWIAHKRRPLADYQSAARPVTLRADKKTGLPR